MKRKVSRRRLTGPIHARIKSLREAKAMTQEDLAKAADVDKTAVSHWENGVSLPDIARLSAIANALGTTVSELIHGERAFGALGAMLEAQAS